MNLAAPYWCPAYVGIGSNLDSPEKQVRAAFDELRSLPGTVVTGTSSLYKSAPFGPVEQGDFINAAASLVTQLAPHELLSELRALEDRHGRNRDVARWGPRTMDLDLLVYSDKVIGDDLLTVPHPGIRERNFVLMPLCELAPHLIVPGLGSVVALTELVMASGGRIQKIPALSNP